MTHLDFSDGLLVGQRRPSNCRLHCAWVCAARPDGCSLLPALRCPQAKQQEETARLAEELKSEQRKGKELERELATLTRQHDNLQRELAGVKEEAVARAAAVAAAEREAAPPPATLGPNEFQILGRPMLGGTLRVRPATCNLPLGDGNQGPSVVTHQWQLIHNSPRASFFDATLAMSCWHS